MFYSGSTEACLGNKAHFAALAQPIKSSKRRNGLRKKAAENQLKVK